MFDKLLQAIRKVVSKLLGKENIQKAMNVEVLVSSKMSAKIDKWTRMYENNPPWMDKDSGVKSIGLPSAIASELARLVTLEMKSEITGSERADALNEFYKKLMAQIRTETEYACAKGGLVFKPYILGDKIAVDCIQADNMFPIEFIDGELVSCIFADKVVIGKSTFTRLEFHSWVDGQYLIVNKAFVNEFGNGELGVEVSLKKVSKWADIDPEVMIGNLSRPLFSYFKMPLANTVDSKSDIGVSVYSKAENLIKDADEQWARILWEFAGSELAIDADATALKGVGANTELPKHSERLFRKLDLQGKNGDFYSVFSPDIRDSSLFNGLNKILRQIEFNCGLAYGTLSEVNETAKTATEIKTSRQRSYSTVADIQKALQTALENLIVSMDELCTLYGIAPTGEYETSFEFDDSLIVDSGTDQAIMLQEVGAGIIKPEIYLMKRYGLTEEQCKEWMPNADVKKEPDDVEEE